MSDLVITDVVGNLRATIKKDGTITDTNNEVVGFINEDGTAGDKDQNFLGEVMQDGSLLDSKDEIVGYVDLGKATLRDKNDVHFATLVKSGEILDRNESKKGDIKNFDFHQLRVVASYFLLVDPDFLKVDSAVDSTPLQGSGLDVTSVDREEERLMKYLKFGRGKAPKVSAPKVSTPPKQAPPKQAPPKQAPPKQAPPKETKAEPKVETKPVETKPVETKPVQSSNIVSETDDQGLIGSDEKARKEAERMEKLMGGPITTPSSTPVAKTSEKPVKTYPVPARPQVNTEYESNLWIEINKVRKDPKSLMDHLTSMLSRFNGNDYTFPGINVIRKTQEGPSAVQEAIVFLQKQAARGELSLSNGLSKSGQDYLRLLSGATDNFHSLETEAESTLRLSKYGKWSGKLSQNVAMGDLSPLDIVASWVIDDGNKNRDHRASLFSDEVNFVGISSAPHVQFTRCAVALLAGSYTEGAESKDVEKEEPKVDDSIEEVSELTEYHVGPISPHSLGYYLEISHLGCSHRSIKLELTKQGTELLLSRTVRIKDGIRESSDRFSLHFSVKSENVEAEYDENAKSLLIILKTGGSESSGPFEAANYKIPADSSATVDEVDVSYKGYPDSFVFVTEPSRYETNVSVNVKGKDLIFNMNYDFVKQRDGTDVTVTKKLETSFPLPFAPSAEQVIVSPNPPKGQQIKILKHKSANVSQPDTEITITKK